MAFAGLHWIRRQQRALARGVLALFCLVWLQAALMPCAVATVPDGMASGAEHDCVYCPPAASGEGHHDVGSSATCTYPGDAQADTRMATAAPLAIPLLVAVFAAAPVPTVEAAASARARPPTLGRTPLAVSYCRYLK